MLKIKFYIVTFLCFFLASMPAKSQQFEFLYQSSTELNLVDAIEDQDGFWIFANLRNKVQGDTITPLYLRLSKNGALIKDSVDRQLSGYSISHVTPTDSSLIISYFSLLSKDTVIKVREVSKKLDRHFQEHHLIDTSLKYSISNARLIEDSLLFIVGSQSPKDTTRPFDAYAYVMNLFNRSQDTLINLGTPSTLLDWGVDVAKIGDKYYFSVVSDTVLSIRRSCQTAIEVRRYNRDFTVDTAAGICISASSSESFFYIPAMLKVDETTFMLVSKTNHNRGNIFMREPQDIGHIVLDTNFNELNSGVYGKANSRAQEGYKVISRYQDNSSVYFGGTENFDPGSPVTDSTGGYYTLVKTDLNGNHQWTQFYFNATKLLLTKVLATSDGGALIAGISALSANDPLSGPDAWIVKVDSNGNYKNVTSIAETPFIPQEDFAFFPNPFKEQITFRQFNQSRKLQMQLFDLQGRKVLEKQLWESQVEIDLSGLSRGTYLYRLLDEKGKSASGKIVKQ